MLSLYSASAYIGDHIDMNLLLALLSFMRGMMLYY